MLYLVKLTPSQMVTIVLTHLKISNKPPGKEPGWIHNKRIKCFVLLSALYLLEKSKKYEKDTTNKINLICRKT